MRIVYTLNDKEYEVAAYAPGSLDFPSMFLVYSKTEPPSPEEKRHDRMGCELSAVSNDGLLHGETNWWWIQTRYCEPCIL